MTLKELRIAAGLLQEDVAKKMNVDQSTVCRWDIGATKPSRKHHKKLSRLYGCSVEVILQAIKDTAQAKEK